MKVSRRQFLGTSATAVLVAGTMAKGKVFGANDRIGVGVMGIHGRGGSHISGFIGEDGSEVVALCDVDQHVLDGRVKEVTEKQGAAPAAYVDIRDMLENDAVDAISIATPNHWHSLGTIWACQQGKHVYVEKPLSHNIWEGRQLVAAAEKYNCVVQHGTQRRSEPNWMVNIKALHDGIIGDVYMARALCYKNRNSIGFRPDEDPPDYLDWNLWQGPAQARAYCGNYVHYNWHWFWAYGNGDIGNQRVHQMDVGVWGMNKGLPTEVFSTGGRYTYEDQGETANTQVATMRYDDGTLLVFEVRGRSTNDESGVRVGNLFYGSEGYFVEGQGFFNTKGEPIPVEAEAPPSKGAYGNFLHAIRTREPGDIHGNALDGHLAAAHCHLANVAYRTGVSLRFDPEKERFVGDHKRKANRLLTRDYRAPFTVPKLA